MPASDTPVPEETGGPVVHDHRRIDPVTGQVRRGKHAASKPAGTPSAGRPGAPGDAPDDTGRASATAAAGSGGAAETGRSSATAAAGQGGEADHGAARAGSSGASGDQAGTAGAAGQTNTPGQTNTADQTTLLAQLAERTSDLQRLQAEYANYRKRVDRDRAAVKEQAVAATLSGLLPVLDDIDRAKEHGELSGGFKSVADQLHAVVARLGLVSYGEKGDPFDPKIHEALMHSYSSEVTDDTCVEILQPGYKVGERILRPARVAVAEPELPESETGEHGTADEEGN